MTFALVELILGHRDQVDISEHQFNAVAAALNRTKELLYIEEKYFLLLQNYYEFERILHDLALQNLLFRDLDRSEMMDDINQVNRHLANMLSAARMYVDHVPQHINSLFGPDSAEYHNFIGMTNAEYDGTLGYRMLYALRNHAQHSDFPVHSITYNSNWINHSKKENVPTFDDRFYAHGGNN